MGFVKKETIVPKVHRFESTHSVKQNVIGAEAFDMMIFICCTILHLQAGLPEVFRAFGSTSCQILLNSAFFPKIRLAAILLRKLGKLSDMIHDI